jgi:hypothetical protein
MTQLFLVLSYTYIAELWNYEVTILLADTVVTADLTGTVIDRRSIGLKKVSKLVVIPKPTTVDYKSVVR